MMPPLPKPWREDTDGEPYYSIVQVIEHGKACAAAEQERILKIVQEQARVYGKTGECMAIGIRAKMFPKADSGTPKDWSAA